MNRLNGKKWRLAKLGTIVCGALLSSGAWAFSLEVAESPSTSLSLTVSAILSAKQSLLLNIYELSSSDVADALLTQIQAGVHVEILEEGQPVGGISAAGRGIQAQLSQAMRDARNSDHFYEMTSHATSSSRASKRRFRFDHAKYAVIDGKSLLIGSENYSPTGNPEVGTKGNRGWEVLIHDRAITAEYTQIFRKDSDMSAGDMIDLSVAGSMTGGAPRPTNPNDDDDGSDIPDGSMGVSLSSGYGPLSPWSQPTLLEADSVVRITSPDNSLAGLVELMDSARSTLDIEQMTFDSGWGKYAPQSPLFQAVVAAARRGVKVRVLLNDEKVFAHVSRPAPSKNLATVASFNQIARSENLDMAAATADIKHMGVNYIHNKGVLVDGDKTLISSINWGNNSVLNNREAAVIITGEDVFSHYETLFNGDWQASTRRAVEASNTMGTIDSLQASNLGTQSEVCPARLHISVTFGNIHSADPDDSSFKALSDSHFSTDFIRTTGSHTCVLTDTRINARTGKSRFIEIRKKADGTRSAVLEGFTTRGEVYSVRTVVAAIAPFDGIYEANVYDGSGPSREHLGSAMIGIETKEAQIIQ